MPKSHAKHVRLHHAGREMISIWRHEAPHVAGIVPWPEIVQGTLHVSFLAGKEHRRREASTSSLLVIAQRVPSGKAKVALSVALTSTEWLPHKRQMRQPQPAHRPEYLNIKDL